jgi:dephospho-CoA kinase
VTRQWIIGLTGGIGSGKSAAAERFASLGIAVVDTDAISHQLTAPGGAAMPLIRATFGDDIQQADGALDRASMRRRVFSDPAAKLKLEAILHPLIRQRSQHLLESAANPPAGQIRAPYAMLVVPLLIESGTYRERVDRLLVVDCPVETQIERVTKRSQMSRDEVMRIVATQVSREQRLAVADDIISNDGSLAHLFKQVDALDAAYRANRGIFPSKD